MIMIADVAQPVPKIHQLCWEVPQLFEIRSMTVLRHV